MSIDSEEKSLLVVKDSNHAIPESAPAWSRNVPYSGMLDHSSWTFVSSMYDRRS